MTWEVVEKGRTQAAADPRWAKEPMVSLYKGGIMLNKVLLDALSLKLGDHVILLIDRARFKVGIKIAETDDDRAGGYPLRPPTGRANAHGGNSSRGLVVSGRKVLNAFPLAKGQFPVTMPSGGMIVEVQLPCLRLPVEPKPNGVPATA